MKDVNIGKTVLYDRPNIFTLKKEERKDVKRGRKRGYEMTAVSCVEKENLRRKLILCLTDIDAYSLRAIIFDFIFVVMQISV